MNKEQELKEELGKLEKCCDWNGFDMEKTPAYKDIIKQLKQIKSKEVLGE